MENRPLRGMRWWVVPMILLVFANVFVGMELRARVELLEAQHQEDVIENIFLGRKLEELHDENHERLAFMECQVDLASAGFRMGHNRAYRMMRAGMLENCIQTQEVYLD